MITIAICTWNRAAMLDRILGEFRALAVPANLEWELLVVNNNCTDRTDNVLESHSQALPIRRAFEPMPGIAHARNRVLIEACGDWILWADDDMIVPPDWLAAYMRAFESFPEAGLFGGPIEPMMSSDFPDQLRGFAVKNLALLAPMLGYIDFGPDTRRLKPGEVFFSGNMALKTAWARRYRFDGRFGRVGRQGLLGGEETVFLQSMLNDAIHGVWVGNAKAWHTIEPARLSRESIWNYFQALGRTQGRIDGIPACATLFNRPRWAVIKYHQCRAASWLAWQAGASWLPQYLNAAKLAGYLAECDAHRNDRKPGYLVPPHRSTVTADA